MATIWAAFIISVCPAEKEPATHNSQSAARRECVHLPLQVATEAPIPLKVRVFERLLTIRETSNTDSSAACLDSRTVEWTQSKASNNVSVISFTPGWQIKLSYCCWNWKDSRRSSHLQLNTQETTAERGSAEIKLGNYRKEFWGGEEIKGKNGGEKKTTGKDVELQSGEGKKEGKKACLLCAVCFTAAPSIPNEGLQPSTLTFRRKCASSLPSTRGLVTKTDSLLVPASIYWV